MTDNVETASTHDAALQQGRVSDRSEVKLGKIIYSPFLLFGFADYFISDKLFIEQLRFTKELKYFLIRNKIIGEKTPVDLEALAALGKFRYSSLGRQAKAVEWQKLDSISRIIVGELPQNKYTEFSV